MNIFHSRKAKLDRSGFIAQSDINILFLKINALWPQNESARGARRHLMQQAGRLPSALCGVLACSAAGLNFTAAHVWTTGKLGFHRCVNLDFIPSLLPKFCSGSSVLWWCNPTGWKLTMIMRLLIIANIRCAPIPGPDAGLNVFVLIFGAGPIPLSGVFYHLAIFQNYLQVRTRAESNSVTCPRSHNWDLNWSAPGSGKPLSSQRAELSGSCTYMLPCEALCLILCRNFVS